MQDAIARYREQPTYLGRLRHFALDRWSYAFYSYSNERYEQTTFDSGWFCTPGQGLEIGCLQLKK